MDEKDLKIQALLERMGEMTQQHEDRVADLRVQITILSNQVNTLNERQAGAEETLEGTVVDE